MRARFYPHSPHHPHPESRWPPLTLSVFHALIPPCHSRTSQTSSLTPQAPCSGSASRSAPPTPQWRVPTTSPPPPLRLTKHFARPGRKPTPHPPWSHHAMLPPTASGGDKSFTAALNWPSPPHRRHPASSLCLANSLISTAKPAPGSFTQMRYPHSPVCNRISVFTSSQTSIPAYSLCWKDWASTGFFTTFFSPARLGIANLTHASSLTP